jgi:hypothetical protein
MLRGISSALFLFVAVTLAASAEVNIAGSIVDQTNAAIAGAEVNAREVATNQSRKTKSQADGSFRFTGFQPGQVELTVRHAGFASQTQSIDVQAGSAENLSITLSTSSISSQVDVSSSSDLLQVSRATQSATISSRELESLPTASRNYTHLIVGEAGVAAALPDRTGKGMNLATAPGTQTDDGNQSLNPSVNGARPTSNAVFINGVDATNMMNGGGSLGNNITVPLDALEAVEVQTALYTANGGRNGEPTSR